jgi:tRNA(fMet)-specific endonuclease VapC
VIYLLDTNIVSFFVRGTSSGLNQRILGSVAETLCVSTISAGELHYGLSRLPSSRRAKQLNQQLHAVLTAIAVQPLPADAAQHYGTIRAALDKAGTPIGGNDLWIAAHALASGMTLVTNNTREFKRVKGLKVEDWTTP